VKVAGNPSGADEEVRTMAVADHRSEPRRRPHIRVTSSTEPQTGSPAARYVWAVARLSLATVFLWAFFDKLFGLGHETASKQAWIHGGHPTMGFLKFSAAGPLKGFYHGIAGAAWADWLFMLGLAGIGAALLLGIGMRVAAASAVVMLVMMWSVVLPPENHVFMDDHLVYALLVIGLALVGAGETLGLGRWWNRTSVVERFPILK
jgi:thiosulfate dehydrogenase (quinone) large subunit